MPTQTKKRVSFNISSVTKIKNKPKASPKKNNKSPQKEDDLTSPNPKPKRKRNPKARPGIAAPMVNMDEPEIFVVESPPTTPERARARESQPIVAPRSSTPEYRGRKMVIVDLSGGLIPFDPHDIWTWPMMIPASDLVPKSVVVSLHKPSFSLYGLDTPGMNLSVSPEKSEDSSSSEEPRES